jgi:hypothetical protein
MSSKILQLSPRSSTRIPRRKIAAQPSWSAAPAPSLDMSLDLSLDMGFVRSWFESESDLAGSSASPQVNWGAISGMALSVGFSLVCWAGVVWIVARAWR